MFKYILIASIVAAFILSNVNADEKVSQVENSISARQELLSNI